MVERNGAHRVLGGNMSKRNTLEVLGVEERMILK